MQRLGQITRRHLLHGAAVTAALLTEDMLSGCATQGASPRPVSRHVPTQIPFQLYTLGIPTMTNVAASLIQDFVDTTFNSKHPGIQASYLPPLGMQQVIAQILAGEPAPAVVASNNFDWPLIAPFLEPLDAHFQQHNIRTSLWASKQLAQYQTGAGLLALPEDAAAQAYIYRQDVLDELGIPYPDPAWTYLDARDIWTRIASTGGAKPRYGASIPWNPANPFPGVCILDGFGGGFSDQAGTKCLLDEPGSVRAGNFVFELFWKNVCVSGDGYPVPGLATGQVAFSQGADPSLLWAVQNLGSSAKWDFIPYPRWPVRPATVSITSFYGINAFTPNKEIAWDLLDFAAIGSEWQRFYMRLSLAPPNQPRLLEEWMSVVRSVAPLLKSKALQYWTEPALNDQIYPAFPAFRYDSSQATALLSPTWGQIWSQKLDVQLGFKDIADRINTLEVLAAHRPAGPTAAQRVAVARQARALFPANGPAIATAVPGI